MIEMWGKKMGFLRRDAPIVPDSPPSVFYQSFVKLSIKNPADARKIFRVCRIFRLNVKFPLQKE